MKRALITGITGQDGSYLAEFLLEKGYEVHGITRRISISNTQRIDHLLAANKIKIHDGDLSDGNSIVRIINEVQPDEIQPQLPTVIPADPEIEPDTRMPEEMHMAA